MAVFIALSGTAYAVDGPNPGQNTIGSEDIIGNEVKSDDIGNGRIFNLDLADDVIQSGKIKDETIAAADLGTNSVTASEIAGDQVGSSEITFDSVGSSEIAPGVVGADELDTIHEHAGPATNISDSTAHDGSYTLGSATVACGTGEDLIGVTVDWTAGGGHNERNTIGVSNIDRGVDPQTATVEVNYDGGATTATFVPTATCIF